MQLRKRGWLTFVSLCFGVCAWLFVPGAMAQPGLLPQLTITGVETQSPPEVVLHLLAANVHGIRLDLAAADLMLLHDNVPVEIVEDDGSYPAGTFTLFLIDLPTGVADQMPMIQEAINQFASPATMQEQVDAVAVYQVGETAAAQLLPPNSFHNSIRNLFASNIEPETAATALVDSIMDILPQINELKPNPDMYASLVVISDGTDAVSTQYQPEEVPGRATSLGIPIHTIWLRNRDLSPASQEFGRDYLEQLSIGTRAVAASLDDTAALTQIWNRIASFREHTQVRYAVPELSGGVFTVQVSLINNPQVQAQTELSIPPNTPVAAINLPEEIRRLQLPSVEDPVKLRLSTGVTWLDGVDRELVAAQLLVNGTTVQTIPVEDLDRVEVEVANLVFGDNTMQLAVLDDQGLRVTSPVIHMTVTEGEKMIPPELDAGGGVGRVLLRVLLGLLVLGILGGGGMVIWRKGWTPRLSALVPRGPSGRVRREYGYDPPAPDSSAYIAADGPARVIAHLEVLESVSRVPSSFPLSGTQVRIGRSPSRTDINFENDITVSRVHASLMQEGAHYRIFDEQSTSGTWVNDQQVPEYGIQLQDGDEIHLGAVHLRYRQP
ncbi:MAG: FHA domain-containing protein [Anaerolineae bacterium]